MALDDESMGPSLFVVQKWHAVDGFLELDMILREYMERQ